MSKSFINIDNMTETEVINMLKTPIYVLNIIIFGKDINIDTRTFTKRETAIKQCNEEIKKYIKYKGTVCKSLSYYKLTLATENNTIIVIELSVQNLTKD